MVVLMKVANQLKYGNALFSPSIHHILSLPGVDHREQISARDDLTNFLVTPIKILVFVVNGWHVYTLLNLLFLFDFVSV